MELFDYLKTLGAPRRPRKMVRYLLYRLKVAAEGGAEFEPEGEVYDALFSEHSLDEFKALFENQPAFTRWEDFAVNWDLPADKRIKQGVVDKYAERAERLGVSAKVNVHRLGPTDYEPVEWPGPVVIVRLRGELQEWHEYVREEAKPFPGSE